MSSPVPQRKISFTAGQTFIDQALWCQGEKVYKTITDIVYGLPTTIRVPAHGIPSGIVMAVWFVNMKSKLFDERSAYFVASIDSNNLRILDHNSFEGSANLGTMIFIPPVDTSNLLVVTKFRKNPSSPVLLEVRSDGVSPGFTLPGNGIIGLELTPDNSKALIGSNKNPFSGIAQIEVTNDQDQVFRPWDYAWEVFPEGTTE